MVAAMTGTVATAAVTEALVDSGCIGSCSGDGGGDGDGGGGGGGDSSGGCGCSCGCGCGCGGSVG